MIATQLAERGQLGFLLLLFCAMFFQALLFRTTLFHTTLYHTNTKEKLQ
jgi:hypothetical protein